MVEKARGGRGQISLLCDHEGEGEAKENKVSLLLHFNFVIALYCAAVLLCGGGGGAAL